MPQYKLRRSPPLRVAAWGLSSNPERGQKTPVWRSPTCPGGSNGGSEPGIQEGRFGGTAGAGLGGTLKRPSSPALPQPWAPEAGEGTLREVSLAMEATGTMDKVPQAGEECEAVVERWRGGTAWSVSLRRCQGDPGEA